MVICVGMTKWHCTSIHIWRWYFRADMLAIAYNYCLVFIPVRVTS